MATRLRFIAPALGVLVFVLALVPLRARAANILFVSDSTSDTNIPMALMADGHTVMTVMGDFSAGSTRTLTGDLTGYDAVFWSATGSGYGDIASDAAMFRNLESYVMGGGRVFVTGYDSVASPTAPMLASFLGATSANDTPGEPGAIMRVENSLTVGVRDIQGMTPSDVYGDTDELTGLTPGTVAVANSSFGSGAQWTLRTLGAGEIAYVSNGAPGGSPGVTSWTSTTSVYNAAIRNFAFAAEGGARPDGAPVIEFTGDNTANEGDSVTVDVSVVDEEGDPVTFSWDLDEDGTFGEMVGATSYTIAAGTTDGPVTVRVGVQASDGTNVHERYRSVHFANVDPSVSSSPPMLTSVGADFRYQIVATDPGGAADPLAYMLTGPSRMTVSEGGLVTWFPMEGDVTGPGESLHVEVVVSDGDDGETTHAWDLVVSPNHVPEGGLLIFPTDGVGVAQSQPRLVMQNAIDADRDPLTYRFQIDRVDTFDSPDLQESGAVAETPAVTWWYVGAPLGVGRWHWRAWANDGTADSPVHTTSFFVVTSGGVDAGPGGSVDAGPGGGGDAGTMRRRKKDSGGCSIGGANAPSSALAWFAVVAVAALIRRRG